MKSIHSLICGALLLAASVPMTAVAQEAAPLVTLDVKAKLVKKTVVRHSMIGPRNTLIFYHFSGQRAVLEMTIDNQNRDFPIHATLHLFAADVSPEGIAKWLNNQHSDALFADAANPAFSHKLPADACKTLSHKVVDRTEQHGPRGAVLFDDCEVNFKVEKFAKESVVLKGFEDAAKVFVKVTPPA